MMIIVMTEEHTRDKYMKYKQKTNKSMTIEQMKVGHLTVRHMMNGYETVDR